MPRGGRTLAVTPTGRRSPTPQFVDGSEKVDIWFIYATMPARNHGGRAAVRFELEIQSSLLARKRMSNNQGLIGDLRDRGTRVTPQRAIIIKAIEKLPGHFTADEIFDEVQKVSSYISLATVYRTLDMLKEMQLVSESHMGTSPTHYALISHATHHHAVCRNCQQTIELPVDLFEPVVKALRDDHGFIADVNHLVVFGWCRACQEERDLKDREISVSN